eukprot:9291765-Heterocapsa_arctica.AAC.1
MPHHKNILIETVHSTFRTTRKDWRDAFTMYVPPCRIRYFDLIIFNEVSTLDAHVWGQVFRAISELPSPLLILKGNDLYIWSPGAHGPPWSPFQDENDRAIAGWWDAFRVNSMPTPNTEEELEDI